MNGNILIRASAGTGKTFALSSHVLRLLLLGEAPDSIVALTFTRLASAEIFDRVATRLAAAACPPADPGGADPAAALSAQLADPRDGAEAAAFARRFPGGIPRAAFAAHLRAFLAAQHRSRFGTIDSFMSSLIRAFPAEAGIRGEIRLLDDDEAALRRERVVEKLLQSRRGGVLDSLETIVRSAEAGRLGKTFRPLLAGRLAEWHERFLETRGPDGAPDRDAWGAPARIWGRDPATAALLAGGEEAARERLDRLADDFRDAALPLCADPKGRDREYVESFRETVLERGFDTASVDKAFVRNFLAAAAGDDPAPTVKCNRATLALSPAALAALRGIAAELRAAALRRQCGRAQGLFVLLSLLEGIWGRDVRGEGELRFSDVPLLVAALSGTARRDLEWRLDGRFRHLAVDEFQDTSAPQWNALRPFADEIAQADDGRSLLIVGDVKQAIYGWRGGDSNLFLEQERSGVFDARSLVESYRFPPEITELVNLVFRGDALRTSFGGSNAAAARAAEDWAARWEEHRSAPAERLKIPKGFARVATVAPPDEGAGEDAAEREAAVFAAEIARRLREVCPQGRGLSVAILVRAARQGVPLARLLHDRHGVRAVWEGDSAIADTPAVRSVLDLLVLAEHPDDGGLAWGHVRSSPLGRALLSDEDRARADGGLAPLSRRIARDLSRRGLPRTVRDLAAIALGAVPPEAAAALRGRFDALVAAAADYAHDPDRAGTMLDFRRCVEARTQRAFADPDTVKVLTIHKSKGLGFDLVFVPLFRGGKATPFGRLHSHLDLVVEGPGRPPSWLLPYGAGIGEDPVVAGALEERCVADALGELCVDYVAMTRAMAELQVLLPADAGRQPPAFLDHVARVCGLPAEWTSGDPDWFAALPARERAEASAEAPDWAPLADELPRAVSRRRTPSREGHAGKPAASLFVLPAGATAAERGTDLHAALARVEWLPATPGAQPAGLDPADLDLAAPSPLRDALVRPADAVDLWRERSFEQLAGGEWISGTFDRVVFRGEVGARRAEIYDWKTNRRRPDETEDAFARRMAETYAGQMRAYRAAVARLAGLPADRVSSTLLLTETRAAVPVA